MCLVFPHCRLGAKAGIWHSSQSNKLGNKDELQWNSGHTPSAASMSSLGCYGTFIFSLFKHLLCLTWILKKLEKKQTVMHKEYTKQTGQGSTGEQTWMKCLGQNLKKKGCLFDFNAWFSFQTLENYQQFFTALCLNLISFSISLPQPHANMIGKIYDIHKKKCLGDVFWYSHASKVVKVTFFHKTIHWLFEFARCS